MTASEYFRPHNRDHRRDHDMRSTKYFNVGAEKKVGIFVEAFNLSNTNNFGASYTGNASSATFGQPTGFIPGIGYPRQVQLGAPFQF